MSSLALNFSDNSSTFVGIPTSGVLVNVSDIAPGVPPGGDQTALADSLSAKCFDLHLALTLAPQASPAASDMIRIAVVQDMQHNGTTPTVAELLNVVSSSAVMDHRNFDNDDRFIWWHDEVIDINSYGSLGASTVATNRFVERSIDLNGAPRTIINQTSATPISGGFMVLLASYQGVTTAELVTRLWYKFK